MKEKGCALVHKAVFCFTQASVSPAKDGIFCWRKLKGVFAGHFSLSQPPSFGKL